MKAKQELDIYWKSSFKLLNATIFKTICFHDYIILKFLMGQILHINQRQIFYF